MENKLTKEQLKNILAMLTMKKNILESCVSDYDSQIKQVESMLKEPSESSKN